MWDKKTRYVKNIINLQKRPAEDIFSSDPSAWIVAMGYSFGVSVTGEALRHVFQSFNGLVSIEMFLGGMPCAYIQFDSPVNAGIALNELDCKYSARLDRVLFLKFANILPEFPRRPLRLEFDSVIPGLLYVPEFINLELEDEMLSLLPGTPDEFLDWMTLNKRKVRHYGYPFDYSRNKATTAVVDKDFPQYCAGFINEYTKRYPKNPKLDQLTINYYEPGHGISPHIDDMQSFIGPIVVLNLGGGIVMDFRKGESDTTCVLEPRSLLIIQGEARTDWEHGIRARTIDVIDGLIVPRTFRWSFTFRTIKNLTAV